MKVTIDKEENARPESAQTKSIYSVEGYLVMKVIIDKEENAVQKYICKT